MSKIELRELIPVDKERDIRFLTIVSALSRGGTERAATNYALGYHRSGFPSAVFAYGGGGVRQTQLEAEGIPVFVGGESPSDFAHTVEQVKAWAPDVLHLHRPGITDPASAAALRALIHPRLRVLETNVFAYVDPSPDRLMIDLHLLLSRWCLWKWTQSIQSVVPRSPGVVVPYSVEASSFRRTTPEEKSSYRRAFGIPEGAFVFGRVGQNMAPKWSPELIFAFDTVARTQPNAWLAACGMPESLKGLADKLPANVRSRVIELPVTDSDAELRRYYGLMDVFVHVSEKGESFGMVLCEAMLCGLPVITVSTPLRDNSQVEVVPNRRAGIIVQNRSELIRAMLAIQKNESTLRSMRQHGSEWVARMYDISVVNQLLLKLARIALGSSSHNDLARCLAADPDLASEAPPGLYLDLAKAAGLQLSLKNRLLTPLVNQPISRRAISFARTLQSLVR